jgi:hypothetical protein
MKVSSQFDGGNIEIVDISRPSDAHLQIRRDSNSEFLQWFNFRVSEAQGVPLTLHIDNAGATSYPPGWADYRAVATYDRQHFFRVPTDYDGQRLTIRHTPRARQRLLQLLRPLLARASPGPHRPQPRRRRRPPRTARPHPRWPRHGPPDHRHPRRQPPRLLGHRPSAPRRDHGRVARRGPARPPARPRGPDRPRAPPPRRVPRRPQHEPRRQLPRQPPRQRRRRQPQPRVADPPPASAAPRSCSSASAWNAVGVDYCLDVHGDEALPYNFIAGPDGVPSFTRRQDVPASRL